MYNNAYWQVYLLKCFAHIELWFYRLYVTQKSLFILPWYLEIVRLLFAQLVIIVDTKKISHVKNILQLSSFVCQQP